MKIMVKKLSKMAGLTPGTPVHIGEKRTEKVKITVIDYNETQFQTKIISNVEECFQYRDTPTISWINVDGVHDINTIEQISSKFNLHPLVLEDIVNTGQRPKFEDFDDYIFLVIKMFLFNDKLRELETEQVSLIIGSNYVISFQEKEGDVFNNIRDRIRQSKGRIRKMGADYLAYALLDAVVDGYFAVLEGLGEKIELLEDDLVSNPSPHTLHKIQGLKRSMIFLRKSVWPLREVVGGIQRAESKLIQDTTRVYLRDVYDHTIQVIDTIESFRDMVSGMLDVYLSSVSNKMNEVMKVLTIFAAIFIPLTFIAGIYGMNFQFLPELKWKWAYPCWWILVIALVVGMLFYFKRKKWL